MFCGASTAQSTRERRRLPKTNPEEKNHKKAKTKVAIFTKHDDAWWFFIFQKPFCWRSFSECIFAEGSFNQKPLALGEIRRSIWRHFVMKLPSKNVKNHENLLFHYSVRQKFGDPGPISMQNMFPLRLVTPKRPELPYGAKKTNWQKIQFFSFSPYWSPIGPLLNPAEFGGAWRIEHKCEQAG